MIGGSHESSTNLYSSSAGHKEYKGFNGTYKHVLYGSDHHLFMAVKFLLNMRQAHTAEYGLANIA